MSKNEKRNGKSGKKDVSSALSLAMMKTKDNLANVSKGSKNKLRDALILIGSIILAMFIFFLFVELEMFTTVFTVYLILWSAAVLAFWIYNRGMISKDTKPEDLSPYWSEEKKAQFIESIKERRRKSRWLLFVIAPITVVFLVYLALDFLLPALYKTFIVNS